MIRFRSLIKKYLARSLTHPVTVIGLLLLPTWTLADTAASTPATLAVQLTIDSAIGPAVHDYMKRGLLSAQEKQANVVVLQIDTPGGLDKSMREIIGDMLASPIPVVSYVAPSGARAASAGTFILYASAVAAMAPGTNLGAASPVSVAPSDQSNDDEAPAQTAMEKKATNDAAAYIRSLAQLHGRNADWAEQAVRAAASLSAEEALRARVIDVIADNIPDLLQTIDGRKVRWQNKTLTLQTANASIEPYQPDWRTQFLSVITDPSVAYLLLMAGIWGLFLEFAYPGSMVPGTLGAIALLIALYAFHLLPISYIGFGLIILGLGFMVAEALVPSFGIFGMAGLASLVIGSIMLIDTDMPHFGIAIPLIISVSVVTGGLFLLVIHLAIRSHKKPVVSGRKAMPGKIGVVDKNFRGHLYVRVNGELWKMADPENFSPGQRVKVLAVDGLVLHVEAVNNE